MAGEGDVIGSAVVNLQANTSGFLGSITQAVSQAEGQFSKMGGGIKGSLAGVGGIMTAGITAPLIGIGAFAIKSASDIDGAFRTLEKQTGATGTELESLKGSVKNVFSTMPISADQAAKSVGEVYRQLQNLNNGVPPTQAAVTSVTTSFEQFAKVAGVDTSTATDTLMRAFKALGVSADEVPGALNSITIAAQQTGDPMDRLMGSISKAAPTFKQLGFGIEDTAAVMAKLDMSGVKTTSVLTGLNKVLKDAATSGVPPKKALADLEDQMKKGNITGAEATTMYKELGVKGFAAFQNAVKGGAFDVQKLTDSMADNSDQMSKSYEDTLSFSDKLTMFKNKLEVAFEPLGKALINVAESALNMLTPLLPIVTNLVNLFAKAPAPLQMVVLALGGILAAIGPVLMIAVKLHSTFTSMQGVVNTLAPKIASMLAGGGGGIGGLLGGGASAASTATGAAAATTTVGAETAVAAAATEATVAAEGFSVAQAEATTSTMALAGELTAVDAEEAVAGTEAAAMGASGAMGGAAAEGGILATVLAGIGPILLPVVAIVAAVGAGFAVLYATSSTFRSMLGGVVTTLQNIMSWVGQIAGALMSGNFSKAGELLKSGFEGAINAIKNFDFGNWAVQMITSIKESVGMIGGIILQGLSQLGDIANTIANWLAGINWNQVIDGLINAITSMFGGGGGGGTAGTKVSTGMNKSLVDGATKAAPQVLAKLLPALLNLGVQLGLILPKVMGAVAMALVNYLMKVDWGAVLAGLNAALIGGAFKFFTAIINLDWGGFALRVITFLITAIPRFLTAVENLDWGGFALRVITALETAAIGFLTAVENLDWGGFANTVITDLGNAATGFLTYLQNLDWGALGTSVLNGIESAFGSFAGWLAGQFGNIGSDVYNSLTKIHFSVDASGIHLSYGAEGGLVTKPTLMVVGEAGPELIVPMGGIKGGTAAAAGVKSLTSAASGASGGAHTGGAAYNFNVTFNNSTITSQQQAEALGLQMGYKARELLRRSGHMKG